MQRTTAPFVLFLVLCVGLMLCVGTALPVSAQAPKQGKFVTKPAIPLHAGTWVMLKFAAGPEDKQLRHEVQLAVFDTLPKARRGVQILSNRDTRTHMAALRALEGCKFDGTEERDCVLSVAALSNARHVVNGVIRRDPLYGAYLVMTWQQAGAKPAGDVRLSQLLPKFVDEVPKAVRAATGCLVNKTLCASLVVGIEGARVQIDGQEVHARQTKDGVHIAYLAPGPHYVRVMREGYGTVQERVMLERGRNPVFAPIMPSLDPGSQPDKKPKTTKTEKKPEVLWTP